MSEQQTPRKGDRVRVSFEAQFAGPARDEFPTARVTVLKDGRRTLMSIPDDATVEVLERADDPELGLVRAVAPTLDGEPKTAVKVGARLSEFPQERSVWVIVETGEVLKDGDVSGLGAVVTALPGTPAGDRRSAEVEHTDQFPPEGDSEVRRVRPRTFSAHPCAGTVEEPPEDVAWVVDTEGDHLRRGEGDGWIGCAGERYPLIERPWAYHVHAKYAPYTEVV